MASSTPSTAKPRSTAPLYWILALSLAPVVFALLAYYVPGLGLRPEGHSNYGALIDPQRPIPSTEALPLRTLDGAAMDLASLDGRWLLVSADQGACPESCVQKLFILRNSHASQGKNVERLARVWFVTDDAPVPAEVLNAYQGTHMLRADPDALARFLTPEAAGLPPAQRDAALRGPMWIIDPLGNLMMAFPPDADPLRVRSDLIKLVRNSRIG